MKMEEEEEEEEGIVRRSCYCRQWRRHQGRDEKREKKEEKKKKEKKKKIIILLFAPSIICSVTHIGRCKHLYLLAVPLSLSRAKFFFELQVRNRHALMRSL